MSSDLPLPETPDMSATTEEKATVFHLDWGVHDEAAPQLKSGFDELNVWKTFLRFKYATLICILISFGGSAEGYQVRGNFTETGRILLTAGDWCCQRVHSPSSKRIPRLTLCSNILANPGFVKQFATAISNGTPILDTNVVASWGAIQSSGQMIGMLFVTPWGLIGKGHR
jgi:hypothetical protein